jgi:hypothetical protein
MVTDWTMPPTGNGAAHSIEPGRAWAGRAHPGRTGPGDARPSDAELIERSRREPDCFAAIFDRHAGEILRYAHGQAPGLTTSAVRSRLHRIRARTRAALGGADPTALTEEDDHG